MAKNFNTKNLSLDLIKSKFKDLKKQISGNYLCIEFGYDYIQIAEAYYSKKGIAVYNDLDKVFDDFSSHDEIVVIGGSDIYRLAFPFVNKLYITYVEGSFSGDTWFPEFNLDDWRIISNENLKCSKSNTKYSAKTYFRVSE